MQLPVLEPGLRARAWRACRSALVPLTAFLGATRRPEFRGFRLSRGELDAALSRALVCESSPPTSARTRRTDTAPTCSSG